ncbi:MAG: hypothetical protein ACRDYE_05100 [Acidimicrobiales bacterium]
MISPDGRVGISYEDYAVALVDEIDEIDDPAHVCSRFRVGY